MEPAKERGAGAEQGRRPLRGPRGPCLETGHKRPAKNSEDKEPSREETPQIEFPEETDSQRIETTETIGPVAGRFEAVGDFAGTGCI